MTEAQSEAALKRQVAERAGGCCEYCRSQARFAPQTFSVEHILPRCRGGATTADNLAFACQGCNNHKYTKTSGIDPVSGAAVPLFHPRKQSWDEHFAWNSDYAEVLGITASGRATVEVMWLNREGLVNLRRILYAAGEHPPRARK